MKKKKIILRPEKFFTAPALIPRGRTDIPEPERKETRRISGHFYDQKLKYNEPENLQYNIFDSLLPETKEKINENNITTIVEGIKLSPAEDKLINSIWNLLQRKSNTKIDEKNKPAEPDRFYRGNLPPAKSLYGGETINIPMLRITPHELYTEYTGSKDYGGYEIETIKKLLNSLKRRDYLIKYKAHRFEKRGKKFERVIDRIEEYQPLLRIIKYYEGLTEDEDKQLDKDNNLINERGEIIIKLNAIFVHQLDTKFIIEPTDLDKRTEIASGGAKRVTDAIIKLRGQLIRKLSAGESYYLIDEDRLPYILGLDNYIKESRKKLIKEREEESINAVINLGLVLEVKRETGKKYQPQLRFILNPDFNK